MFVSVATYRVSGMSVDINCCMQAHATSVVASGVERSLLCSLVSSCSSSAAELDIQLGI